MVTRIAIFLLFIMISPFSQALSTLTAKVDHNPAMVGETVVLTITADDHVNANNLDTSALLQQFIVGQTNISRTMQAINGRQKRQTSWNIHLIARTTGQFTIPSFTLNNISSAPTKLNVVKVSTTPNQTNQDVILEAKLASTNVYVGQHITYQVKLSIGVSLQRAQLHPPELATAQISQIGEDIDTTEIINGRRYRVFTRTYAIRPTESGSFTLQGSIFRGDIQVGQRDFFNNGRSKPVTLLTENQTLTVKAIPNNFPGQWLVSDVVALQEQWPTPKSFTVGEPITRTLTLTATNIAEEQLPQLSAKLPDSFQAYPDKPVTQTITQDGVVISQLIQKIAMIPTKPGQFTLPAVKIPWLNAATGQIEWAIVAGQQITVIANPINQPQLAPQPELSGVVQAQEQDHKPSSAGASAQLTPGRHTLIYWQFTCLLLILLCIILLGLYIRLRRTVALSHSPIVNPLPKTNNTKYWPELKIALQHNQPQQVIRLMPLWLKQLSIDPQQVTTVAPALHLAYQQLMTNCYQQQPINCDCNDLLTHCLKLIKIQSSATQKSDSLYPSEHK